MWLRMQGLGRLTACHLFVSATRMLKQMFSAFRIRLAAAAYMGMVRERRALEEAPQIARTSTIHLPLNNSYPLRRLQLPNHHHTLPLIAPMNQFRSSPLLHIPPLNKTPKTPLRRLRLPKARLPNQPLPMSPLLKAPLLKPPLLKPHVPCSPSRLLSHSLPKTLLLKPPLPKPPRPKAPMNQMDSNCCKGLISHGTLAQSLGEGVMELFTGAHGVAAQSLSNC
mmetsp:Transcript_11361/g.26445  ORF Transcript_11361/g.26445 Transcript_11361/m.26445 type:complete len:223 (+) Transcript_11361:302-970(+)